MLFLTVYPHIGDMSNVCYIMMEEQIIWPVCARIKGTFIVPSLWWPIHKTICIVVTFSPKQSAVQTYGLIWPLDTSYSDRLFTGHQLSWASVHALFCLVLLSPRLLLWFLSSNSFHQVRPTVGCSLFHTQACLPTTEWTFSVGS